MKFFTKKSAALAAAMGVGLVGFIPTAASAAEIPLDLCSPRVISTPTADQHTIQCSKTPSPYKVTSWTIEGRNYPNPAVVSSQASGKAAKVTFAKMDGTVVGSAQFSLPRLTAAATPAGASGAGILENPLRVTPHQLSGLMPSPSVDFGQDPEQFGNLYVGSKSDVERRMTEVRYQSASRLKGQYWAGEPVATLIQVDRSRLIAVNWQWLNKAFRLDEATMEAYRKEIAAVNEKFANPNQGFSSKPTFTPEYAVALAKKCGETVEQADELNKLAHKYVGVDFVILPETLQTFVADHGGYGLLTYKVPSSANGTPNYNATVVSLGSKTSSTSNPFGSSSSSESDGDGFGGIAIIGVILAAVVGILMSLNIIPRFW